MHTIILLGPAGSGKGTQAQKLIEHFHLQKVEMGELVRAKGKEDSDLGHFVHTIDVSGKHLPDDVVAKLLEESFGKLDPKRGLLIDGYPRSIGQAKNVEQLLTNCGRSITHAIVVSVSDDVARKRLLTRAVCSSCKAILSSRDIKNCPTCGQPIEIRPYDTDVEAINKRLAWFHDNVVPAIDYFRTQGLVREVNGEDDPETVFQNILRAIDGLPH